MSVTAVQAPTATASTEARGGSPLAPGAVSRVVIDVAITVGALVLTVAQLAHSGGDHPRLLDVAPVAVAALGATAPLLLWRRFPLMVFVASAAVSVVGAALGYPVDVLVGPVVALYLLAASRQRDVAWTWRTSAVVVGLLVAYLVAVTVVRGGLPGTDLLHTGIAAAAAWFAGERTRLRREQLADLRVRALRAEREAQNERRLADQARQLAVQERRLAVTEERARIARDLHDSAGHAISVIAVRAGAARLHDRRKRSLAALTAIEELARQTAEEIDRIVGTLREPGQTPPAGLAALDSLIAHHAATGLAITRTGCGQRRTLPAAVDQAAYRILQEALTNAARYGTGGADIELTYGEDALEITVSNPVSAGPPAGCEHIEVVGGGHGLIGMRERATLLGGGLRTVRADGRFQVHAKLPYDGRR